MGRRKTKEYCRLGCKDFKHLFRMPKCPAGRQAWREILNLGPEVSRPSTRVCNNHFAKEMFTVSGTRLHATAMPLRQFPPYESAKPTAGSCGSKSPTSEDIKIFPYLIMADNVKGLTDAEAHELCKSADPSTKDFLFQQTMYRIKDPKKSLPFYTGVLGMTLLQKLDFPEAKFSLYFMGYENPSEIPSDKTERTKWAMSRKATIELTHNWGTENDPEHKYHNGNSEPRGYGHIGVMVPDVYAACKRFEELGVDFVKKPDDGRMKGLAFIKDPDGYWIEIFNANTVCN